MSNVDLENLVDMLAVKFGAGTSGDFDELDSLVRGAEHFTADLFMQGQAYACFFQITPCACPYSSPGSECCQQD